MANGKMDLRLDLAWPSHPKTLLLEAAAGPAGPLCLIRLWCFAGLHHRDGVLRGMKVNAIELAAGWKGSPGEFHAALIEIGWLESDGVTLHDWPDEQPYLFGAAGRTEHARALARLRWGRKSRNHASGNALRIAARISPGNAVGNAPYPYPDPIPEDQRSPHPTDRPELPEPGVVQRGSEAEAEADHGATCRDPLCCSDGLANLRRAGRVTG